MRKEFDEEDELTKPTRGKKNNQKMKPFLVYQYLMRHTDENHVIRADDICLAMTETYGVGTKHYNEHLYPHYTIPINNG